MVKKHRINDTIKVSLFDVISLVDCLHIGCIKLDCLKNRYPNDFNDNPVIAVPNLKGVEYMKVTIRIKFEWEPPRCNACVLFGADDDGFVEVKRRKLDGNNGSNRYFKSVLVKPETQYRPKAKQWTTEMASPASRNKASNKMLASNKEIMEDKIVLVDDDVKSLEEVSG
ncbi:hypothetical protein Tco_0548182 [Tanacetum coccineum]